MKEIKLTQGRVALVDDEDYEYLVQWKWHAHKDARRDVWYAKRNINLKNGHYKSIQMHRIIMNTKVGMEVDHIDGDGLNNQKYNLRNCFRSGNMRNRRYTGKVEYLGVHIRKNRGTYVATIHFNKNLKYLGSFKTAEEAAIAYNKAAIEIHGEFARLNIIP